MNNVDPRLAFLARAAVAQVLVETGELDLDVAIEELARNLDVLRPCACAREYTERLERYQPRQNRGAVA